MPRTPLPQKARRTLAKRWWAAIGMLVFLLVGGGIVCVRLWLSSSKDMADQRVVKAAVAQHMVLPADEEPALATVTDKNKLTTPFLKKAEDGDTVLIYQKNHLAIIYRPAIDRIVAVGTVTIDNPQAKASN